MGMHGLRRFTFERDFRRALAAGELEVHYQPIVEVQSRRKIAAEALIRWHHPSRGMMQPDAFIPFAESTKLINGLGDFVLKRACADAAHWPSDARVAVNLSPVQFETDGLAESVTTALDEAGLSPERLELEITESVLLHSSEANINTLHALRDLGVSIALDDFGTGYSSLSYLRCFPFDKIKIDRSFVSEMPQMDVCAAIVCAVANLGRSLDIVTTAEGVETEEQFELLHAAGCTQAQGYLFGKPTPVEHLCFDGETKPAPEVSSTDGQTLTARDIMLVRTSFALVAPMQDLASQMFYGRLFTIAPHLRNFFPADMTAQRQKVISMLASCIGKLSDLPSLTPAVRDLGARHVAYGTLHEHYPIVGEALIWTLDRALGDKFTPETRAAWTKVYGILANQMQAGAAQITAARVAI